MLVNTIEIVCLADGAAWDIARTLDLCCTLAKGSGPIQTYSELTSLATILAGSCSMSIASACSRCIAKGRRNTRTLYPPGFGQASLEPAEEAAHGRALVWLPCHCCKESSSANHGSRSRVRAQSSAEERAVEQGMVPGSLRVTLGCILA